MKKVSNRTYIRFSKHTVAQHAVLSISILILGFTGFCISEPDSILSGKLVSLGISIISLSKIHITFAFVLLTSLIWHFLSIVFTKGAHDQFMQMLPKIKDFKDYKTAIKFQIGNGESNNQIDRYGYQEKMAYWGTGIYLLLMVSGGLVKYLYNYSSQYLSEGVYIFFISFHSVNGLSIGLLLTIWHLYSIFLKPERFPGTLSWYNGKVTKEEIKQFHNLEWEKTNK